MPASAKSVDERLRRVAGVKQLPPESARDVLRKALADKIGLVVAKAADLAAELKMPALIPDLVAAFAAHRVQPERTDKGCMAKIAIVRALHNLDYDDCGIFEKGLSHVQLEPTWGGGEDTAIPLRAFSAIALAGQRHPRVLELLIPPITDPAAQVRAAAMRAIAATGREEGRLLLRLKALIGDTEEDVLTECFSALLELGGQASLNFVADFLDRNDEPRRTAATLAVGASRLEQAFDLLHSRFSPAVDTEYRQVLLLAMSTLRDPRAMSFLLTLIREGPFIHASEAIRILKASRVDERTRELIRAAITERDDQLLRKVLDEPG
jgi:HEAT repeat protein